MKLWVIKRKGADYWGNYMHSREIEYSDGTTTYAQLCFYRKKDAVKYLNTNYEKVKDYFEVVGKA